MMNKHPQHEGQGGATQVLPRQQGSQAAPEQGIPAQTQGTLQRIRETGQRATSEGSKGGT